MTSIANTLPGVEILGYGFDIFGRYAPDRGLQPLFDLGQDLREWTYKTKNYDTSFLISSNVSDPGPGKAIVDARGFSGKLEFAQHFAARVNASGAVGAFSGQFSASYSGALSNESEYAYGLQEAHYRAWSVDIRDFTEAKLLKSVTSDPDFNLPKQFTTESEQAYYRFFRKFGTHFIHRAFAGGHLYYYVAVNRSYTSNTVEIKAKVSAEFNGLVATDKASADAAWNSASQQWSDQRQSHLETVPATASLNWTNPTYGSWDRPASGESVGPYREWQAAVERAPNAIGMELRPIWDIFSRDKATELQKAYERFANNRAIATASLHGVAIVVNDRALAFAPPEHGSLSDDGTFCAAVLDRYTLKAVWYKAYGWVPGRDADDYQDQIVADLNPYVSNTNFILVVAVGGAMASMRPRAALASILRTSGAGGGLSDWLESVRTCGATDFYTLIGLMGSSPGMGFERVAPWGHQSEATADALLLPEQGPGNKTWFSPVAT